MKIDIYDPSRCRATGDGLNKARENNIAMFTVDPQGAGKGELNVLVEGEFVKPLRNTSNFLVREGAFKLRHR